MTEPLLQVQLWIATLSGLFCIALAAFKRLPSLISLGSLAAVEVLLLVQLVWSIFLVAGGASAKGDTVEFLGYIITALFVAPGAALWALVERTRWSTMILGIAALTVAVMLVRMSQIWYGTHF